MVTERSDTDEIRATTTADEGSGGVLTVVIAFAANLFVAIAKTIAALLTGSASMVAESAHSWADTGNEIFLLVAERRGAKPGDQDHPLGYGRESYVWSMFAAFGLFTAGAVVSIWHGVTQLTAPEESENYLVAYIVLAVSAVFEGTSFLQAYRRAHRQAAERDEPTLSVVLQNSNPTLRAVFAEDSAALVGLAIAFLGILLHQLTGSPVYDALGSIGVGLLLGVVAIILIDRNRRFLVGQVPDDRIEGLVLAEILKQADVEKVTYLHIEFVGSARIYVVAAIDLTGNDPESDVAADLRRIEQAVERDPHVAEAVLTLSAPGAPALDPPAPEIVEQAPDLSVAPER